MNTLQAALGLSLVSTALARAEPSPVCISGVYPHLTLRNDENECGTGAAVPWQGSLWLITYAPHQPGGSTDKLYEVTEDLELRIFPGSVGGTPANRMIHLESGQLLIGPYLIDSNKHIRVIPPSVLYGRLTGNARHLSDPANKVYYATMEEGLYEVDVRTLEVNCLIHDGNPDAPGAGSISQLLGYHGKGLYSGQNRVVYANNGDRGPGVLTDPTVESGALAEWFGAGDWQLVRRNQFTEVTGPGGIRGGSSSGTEPIWAMGWDARSLLLAVLENGEWHYYRMPKGSHSYDGAHGWNTEWPRIREIGETDLLATMHGTCWRFPADFSVRHSAGIAPRSNYLRVIGDFCRWNGRIVMGCDDSARSEFLNKRSFKSHNAAPRQSNSSLWFIAPERLDELGPLIGRGSVWLRDNVPAGRTSHPFLFNGYDHRQLHLTHQSDHSVTVRLEVDRKGEGQWDHLRDITVPARGAVSYIFDEGEIGAWIRLTPQQSATFITAHFQYRSRDARGAPNDPMFDGIATLDQPARSFGLMRSQSYNRLGLVAAPDPKGKQGAYYELNPQMELVPVNAPGLARNLISDVQQPRHTYSVDAASVLIVEDGKRYRLPKNPRYMSPDSISTLGRLEDFLGESLMRGARVKASSTHENYLPVHAVDGLLTEEARWIGRNPGGSWIEIDWDEEKEIHSLWIVSGWQQESRYVARDFDVQFKQGGQWKTVPGGAVRGNSRIQAEIVLDPPVKARQLRLTTDSGEFFRIYELAAFDRVLDISHTSNGFGVARICREVATERDLLNLHGTFYELPARNAQGVAKIRPIATHNLALHDFCSHNGLLFITGIDDTTEGHHIFRSADRKAAVWAGVVDDLWKLGKPRGVGGPWLNTHVNANQPSDPYLMTAYDRKQVAITSSKDATITLEVDLDGTGLWIPWRHFSLKAGASIEPQFPEGFSAYWVRAISDRDTTASVLFTYE